MWSPTGIARRHAWRAAITRNRFIQAFTITPRKKVYYRLRQKRTKYNLEKTNLYNRLYPEAQTAFSLYIVAKIKRSKLTTGRQRTDRPIGTGIAHRNYAVVIAHRSYAGQIMQAFTLSPRNGFCY